jgi:mannose-6-phosphate isomerase-like protein (cupin superfamily)
MQKKTLEKGKAELGCRGTLFGEHMFTNEMEGYLDEVVWGFLKKGMKVYPHKHPEKEVYIFVSGQGFMQVEQEETAVKKGDVIYIEPNSMHTAWNNEETDLEFILLRSKNLGYLTKKLARLLSFLKRL